MVKSLRVGEWMCPGCLKAIHVGSVKRHKFKCMPYRAQMKRKIPLCIKCGKSMLGHPKTYCPNVGETPGNNHGLKP